MGSSDLTLNVKTVVQLAQRSLAFGSVGASYTIAGTIFGQAIVTLVIYSSFNADVQISLDGVNDFIPIPALGTLIINLKSNLTVVPANYGVYVKQITAPPASGSIYIGALGLT